MCNFQLCYCVSSKQPALYGWLTHCTTVIDTAGTEGSEIYQERTTSALLLSVYRTLFHIEHHPCTALRLMYTIAAVYSPQTVYSSCLSTDNVSIQDTLQ